MNILYIVTLADGGGAQKYTLALAKHFKGIVAAGTESQQLFEDARAAGLQTFGLRHLKRNISPWHDILAIFEIAKLIRKLKPDIIHLNSTKAGFLGSLAGGLARITGSLYDGRHKVNQLKIIFTAHGFRYLEPLPATSQKFYIWVEKYASLFRDHIIAVSQTDYNSAVIQRITAPKKISVINNGIPQIVFFTKDQACTHLQLSQDKIQLGSIGGFYPTKGFDILIDAINQLPDEIKQKIHLTIIGDGPEFKNLKSKIKNLDLENIIALPGNIPEANRYLKAFDIFIIPSRKEGVPYTLLEAMQAGLPIVATKVGGIPEVLKDGGVLISPADHRILTKSISILIDNPDKTKGLGVYAQKLSHNFSEEVMFNKTKQIYEQLLK